MLRWTPTKRKAFPGNGKTLRLRTRRVARPPTTVKAGKAQVPVYTLFRDGVASTFTSTPDKLARRLYLRCTQPWRVCERAARRLQQGRVFLDPDEGLAVFPGTWLDLPELDG